MVMCIHGQEYETCRFGCTFIDKETLRLQNDRLRALCWRESQALKEALKRKDNKSMIAVVADSLEAEGLQENPNCLPLPV